MDIFFSRCKDNELCCFSTTRLRACCLGLLRLVAQRCLCGGKEQHASLHHRVAVGRG